MYNKMEKKIYVQPEITSVDLDKQISLALASLPPIGPGEEYLFGSNNEDPFFVLKE
jgi:hypothetical protein